MRNKNKKLIGKYNEQSNELVIENKGYKTIVNVNPLGRLIFKHLDKEK